MKIQELAIIFVIIILPISLLLSEYTQFQIQTIKTQTVYDSRLTTATYDAIKAFQLNAANSTTSSLANSRIRDIEASVSAFRNSIMSGFKLNGYTEDYLNNYIPALVYTLYDGFYIYSPYENTHDEGGNRISGDADSIYGLKPYIGYSCRYKTTDIDVVITYALDNYITVQGQIEDDYVNKSGYLIDNIVVNGDSVTYNGANIEIESLKEYAQIPDVDGNTKEYPYRKINGIKYYLIEDYLEEDTSAGVIRRDAIVYVLNGVPIVQFKETESQFVYWKNLILNNDSAIQYYKDAKEFTDWLKASDLKSLTYANAYDVDGTTPIWENNTTAIFDDTSNNIENELSNFNQHRLAVIRHKIETNLAIAISNYNEYSGAANTNVFQMPELKENEWEHITHNISVISFLQGLPIGGKIYNGYSIVTNSQSKEVVLENNIYILASDANYHKIGDKGFENTGTLSVDAGVYADTSGQTKSAGRLNLDFERSMIYNSDISATYYYPLERYKSSYDSIVMQNNVTTYDDIYQYVNSSEVNGRNNNLKTAFYTALGRERYSAYKTNNVIKDYYGVLVIGISDKDYHRQAINEIKDELNEIQGIKAVSMFSNNDDYIAEYIEKQKSNYNLIILHGFVWPYGSDTRSKINDAAEETNIITISNDQTGLPMMQSGATGSLTVVPEITNLGKEKLTDIEIEGISDAQAYFEFKDNVEVFYTGTYSGDVTGEYDLIGSWQNGDHKWIHSQVSLTTANHKKLLKELVKYALDIN